MPHAVRSQVLLARRHPGRPRGRIAEEPRKALEANDAAAIQRALQAAQEWAAEHAHGSPEAGPEAGKPQQEMHLAPG